MSEREELEAVVLTALQRSPSDEKARAIIVTRALLNEGYTKGNGEPVAYLRDAQPDAEDEALFVCAKGDSGCFPVYADPVPDKPNGELVEAVRERHETDDKIMGMAGLCFDKRWKQAHADRKALLDALSDSEGVATSGGDAARSAAQDTQRAERATNGGRDETD